MNRTGQKRTEEDRTGQNRTEQDRTGQKRTEQDRTGRNRTEQDRTRQVGLNNIDLETIEYRIHSNEIETVCINFWLY